MRLLEDQFRSRVWTFEWRRSAPAPGLVVEHSSTLTLDAEEATATIEVTVEIPALWSFTDPELAIVWKELKLWYDKCRF